jgi:hypothetical protein
MGAEKLPAVFSRPIVTGGDFRRVDETPAVNEAAREEAWLVRSMPVPGTAPAVPGTPRVSAGVTGDDGMLPVVPVHPAAIIHAPARAQRKKILISGIMHDN